MDEQVTAESLIRDPDYRWNDNLTDDMTVDQLREYLAHEAARIEAIEEWEVAYGIYREFVWRFPGNRDAWLGLARSARQMAFDRESHIAERRAAELTDAR